jgi:hypothetical protein
MLDERIKGMRTWDNNLFDEICAKHERAPGGIASRLQRLKLVPDQLNTLEILDLIQNRFLEKENGVGRAMGDK